MTATANDIIEKIKRLSPPQARQLRQRLTTTAQERKRQETQVAVQDYHARQRNGQQPKEIEQETIEAPTVQQQDRSGGRRRSGVTWHGVELERQD